MALAGSIGRVEEKSGNHVVLHVGTQAQAIHRPHTKDLTEQDVTDVRHLLSRAGYTAETGPPSSESPARSAAPDLLVAIAHHEARIYRLSASAGAAGHDTITPYDPHHFLHHMRHKDEDRERGQKSPEDATFYARIADAVAPGGRIVIIGHGKGASNAGAHFAAYLQAHHKETLAHLAADLTADLSALTDPQLLVLAKSALNESGA